MQSIKHRVPGASAAPSARTLRNRILVATATVAAALGLHAGGAKAQSSTIAADAAYSCDFENSYCDFYEQSKVASSGGRRSTFVPVGASGTTAVKLTTLPGDNTVNGSGTWERNDLSKPAHSSYCNPGQEEWWAFSIMFPADYVFPPGPEAGIIMDFHHTGSSGQANYEIQTIPGIGLRARGFGGASVNSGKYDALIADPYGAVGTITRNQWYHFVLHVKWSANGDGLMEGWLNGKKYQSYQGATLYAGQACYLKLANYHGPFGQSSSIVHDRVVRGTSAKAVTLQALEGVAGSEPDGIVTTTPAPAPSLPATTTYALATVTTGSGTGSVTSSPSGINCGSSCTNTFASGTAVTLNASPASGSSFSGWSGACSGTGACTVSMSSAKSVTATFAASAPSGSTSGGVAVSESALYFNGTAGTRTVTYTNNGSAKVTFIRASVSSAKFSQKNNCGEVAPGKSCTATVTYYPTNSGSTTGTFTMTSTASSAGHVVGLSSGSAPVVAPPPATNINTATTGAVSQSASSLAFSNSAVTRTVTFTNTSATKVTFVKASMSSAKFGQSNTCGEVAPGQSCTATVTYYPTNSGSSTATFTVTSTAPNSPHVVNLAAATTTVAASTADSKPVRVDDTGSRVYSPGFGEVELSGG